VETLRHTGVRIEEMLEVTQLSLRHYTSQTSGTLVPLLHIVPSKTDVERLIPMSPELVTVLLAVQRRAKAGLPGDEVQRARIVPRPPGSCSRSLGAQSSRRGVLRVHHEDTDSELSL
jgi:hypothetical protein